MKIIKEIKEKDVIIDNFVDSGILNEQNDQENKLKFILTESAADILDSIIYQSCRSLASDIHIDPLSDRILIKLRIDGFLVELVSLPLSFHPEIISRIKMLSGLRIDGRNFIQDGRISQYKTKDGTKVDMRVSIIPTIFGENVVIRILGKSIHSESLDNLGFSFASTAKILRALNKKNGMILVSGPTGSGKTTTLYSLLRILPKKDRQVITLEDPVEYSLSGVRQIQVNNRVGINFSSGLRGILRQDPDVIMLGEIRDEETAKIASHASLSGHLILSTIHTNSAAESFIRLSEMGVMPYIISSTVSLVISQRLVRKVCLNCQKHLKINSTLFQIFKSHKINPPDETVYGSGCIKCNYTGYLGRCVVAEAIFVDKKIRQAISSRTTSEDIEEAAKSGGDFESLEFDSLSKAAVGIISIEEALSVSNLSLNPNDLT